jgi:hypothetical protein
VFATPIGCCLFKVPNSENPIVDVPGLLGLAGPVPAAFSGEFGTGGKESIRAAPNDDVGLNGFNPANPVICGFNCVVVPLPAPVGNDAVAVTVDG